tara:strand:+ start:6205 stop:7440 length:1236 start_codon:yes stop_codon:yes gene_type:complete
MKHVQIAIIGGGLAGLSAATVFEKNNINYLIIEKDELVGGKQKTSIINDYICDHGFQILLTAYPDVKRLLSIKDLSPQYFSQGAKVWNNDNFYTIPNPLKNPLWIPYLLFHPILKKRDCLALLRLKLSLKGQSLGDIFSQPNQPTHSLFENLNFSKACQDLFLKPFFRGVYLENDLETSARLCLFYWKCFLEGYAIIPKNGIAAIPNQLAATLNQNNIMCNTQIIQLHKNLLTTSNDTRIKADYICCATDYSAAATLFKLPKQRFQATKTYYYETGTPVINNCYLHLDGSTGPINNLYNVTAVNKYAGPQNKTLISVSTLPTATESDDYEKNVKAHLKTMFGNAIENWNLVTHFHIPKALHYQPISYGVLNTHYNSNNIYFCGDWTIQGSIQGALYSGRKVAESLVSKLTS